MNPSLYALRSRKPRAHAILLHIDMTLLNRFYISCKPIAILLQQPIWSLHFDINASYWLSAYNVDPALQQQGSRS